MMEWLRESEDVADMWRVQQEEFNKEKYIEIAKKKQSKRIPQVGHYKIQTQNVKKLILITNSDVYKSKLLKHGVKYRFVNREDVCNKTLQKGDVDYDFFSKMSTKMCTKKEIEWGDVYRERKTRVNTWIIMYPDMTYMESHLSKCYPGNVTVVTQRSNFPWFSLTVSVENLDTNKVLSNILWGLK